MEGLMMEWIHKYQLFLFDFDGLLVDTEPLHYLSYKELCRKRGYDLSWDFTHFCLEAHARAGGVWEGLKREFPQLFEKECQIDVLYEEKKALYVDLLKTTSLQLMPGVESLLAVLEKHQIKRAVVTNSPRAHISLIQHSLPQLQSIPLWVTREDYNLPKPAPDGYRHAIDSLGKEGDRIIGFEDTLKGLKALLTAGAEGILVCPSDHRHVQEGLALGARHISSIMDFH